MKKRGILVPVPCLAALLVFAIASYASILPNGLSLEDFQVKVAQPALVGARVDIEYTLKNLGAAPIVLELPGPFVAARCDGNNTDFGHLQKAKEIRPGETTTIKASRVLDAEGAWHFWPGFKINGAWGPQGWMEKVVDVFSGKSEAESSLQPLSVAKLLSNPGRYDNRKVTVVAEAFAVRKKVDRNKRPWNLISLVDRDNRKAVISAFALGHAPIGNGDTVKITGTFKVKSKRGKYHYDNEIDATKGSIEKLQ